MGSFHIRCMLLFAFLLAALPLSALVRADEPADQTWDPRLNGIWKVTSVVQDGIELEDDTDCKYAILDGIIVSAYPRSASLIPEPADGDGSREPLGKPDSKDDGSLFPPRLSAKPSVPRRAEEPLVELRVSKATATHKKPYSWIDLESPWEEEEEWPGIYHIEGDTLTIAFGEVRPTKLESPKVATRFTRPAPVSKVITLVRQAGTGADDQK